MLQLFIMFFSVLLCSSSLFANEEVWGYKRKEVAQVVGTAEKEIIEEDDERTEPEAYEKPTEQKITLKETKEELSKPDYIAIPVLKENLRTGTIISENDVTMSEVPVRSINEETVMNLEDIVGKQARRSLSKGRPIENDYIGSPLLIKRNQNVEIIFRKGALLLSTNGRALDQGGAGDKIKVMNLESKKVVTGRVTAQGDIDVTL